MKSAEDTSGTAGGRAEQPRRLELVKEELEASKTLVQTGVVRIRTQVVTETRTIQVTVRREEVVVERRPIEPQTDRAAPPAGEHLPEALAVQVRDLQPGETIRIPVVEEEVVVQTRPVVVEEVIVGKRVVQTTQLVSGTVRREEARVETTGDIQLGRDEQRPAGQAGRKPGALA